MSVIARDLNQLNEPDDKVPVQRKFDICLAFDSKFATCTEHVEPLELICMYVCCCNEFPTIKNKEGDLLKQACVNFNMARNSDTEKANLLIALMYNMTVTPPSQIYKGDGSAPVSNIFEAVKLVRKTAVGAGGEMIEKYTKGTIRIPDFVQTRFPGWPARGENIEAVYEVKFPGDKWGEGQREAYEKIAGDPDKLMKIIPDAETDKSGQKGGRRLSGLPLGGAGLLLDEIMDTDEEPKENVHDCECKEKKKRRDKAAKEAYAEERQGIFDKLFGPWGPPSGLPRPGSPPPPGGLPRPGPFPGGFPLPGPGLPPVLP